MSPRLQQDAPSNQAANIRNSLMNERKNHNGNGHMSDSNGSSNGTGYSSDRSKAKDNSPRGGLLHNTKNAENGMAAPAAAHTNDAHKDFGEHDYYPKDMQNGAVRADTQDSLANVRTVSRVPDNNTYYEKHGLR